MPTLTVLSSARTGAGGAGQSRAAERGQEEAWREVDCAWDLEAEDHLGAEEVSLEKLRILPRRCGWRTWSRNLCT